MRVSKWWLVLALGVLLLVPVAEVLAQAQAFQPLDDFSDSFSRSMYTKVGKAVGIVAMIAIAIVGLTTRGHGTEIILTALFVGISLAFLFAGPTYLFPLLGYQPQ